MLCDFFETVFLDWSLILVGLIEFFALVQVSQHKIIYNMFVTTLYSCDNTTNPNQFWQSPQNPNVKHRYIIHFYFSPIKIVLYCTYSMYVFQDVKERFLTCQNWLVLSDVLFCTLKTVHTKGEVFDLRLKANDACHCLYTNLFEIIFQ